MRRRRSASGGLDGGPGRGVRLGGSDTAAPSPGPRKKRDLDLDDDEALMDVPSPLDGYDDDGDANPGDRRRDPLRRP